MWGAGDRQRLHGHARTVRRRVAGRRGPLLGRDSKSWFKCAEWDQIHNAIGLAYEARHDETLRIRARAFGLGYDADRVMRDFWTPVLAELEPQKVGVPSGRPDVFVRQPKARAA